MRRIELVCGVGRGFFLDLCAAWKMHSGLSFEVSDGEYSLSGQLDFTIMTFRLGCQDGSSDLFNEIRMKKIQHEV